MLYYSIFCSVLPVYYIFTVEISAFFPSPEWKIVAVMNINFSLPALSLLTRHFSRWKSRDLGMYRCVCFISSLLNYQQFSSANYCYYLHTLIYSVCSSFVFSFSLLVFSLSCIHRETGKCVLVLNVHNIVSVSSDNKCFKYRRRAFVLRIIYFSLCVWFFITGVS